ncbi:arabinogalactan protein 21 [Punica granatum]|uniref:Arabinogalactan protein 21 n=1 Tax=Punica granatum TaxID=22663 RepID=A0A218WAQ3_PUNGR|nr:arabinogalactan protein 21 [Punica granatum]OWM69281.1 hypothetical protein CDL15_Pgr025468 [Punica granatum]
MEVMRMKLLAAFMLVALVASAAVQKAAAAEAPAPSPASDATAVFVPTLFASVASLAAGFLL